MVKIENNQAFTTDSDKKIFRVSQPTTYFSRCTLLPNETEKDFSEILTSEIPNEPTEPSQEDQRREEYKSNTDPILMEILAYREEGNTEKADELSKVWKAKKQEIREQHKSI